MSGSLWNESSATTVTGVGSGAFSTAAGESFVHGGGSVGAGGSAVSGAASIKESNDDKPLFGRGFDGAGSGGISATTDGGVGMDSGGAVGLA